MAFQALKRVVIVTSPYYLFFIFRKFEISGYDKVNGVYLLGPGKVNTDWQHWDYSYSYWISADGTKAIWYCKTCKAFDFIIGKVEQLGTKSGILFADDGCTTWHGCKVQRTTRWLEKENGEHIQRAITVTVVAWKSDEGMDSYFTTHIKDCLYNVHINIID